MYILLTKAKYSIIKVWQWRNGRGLVIGNLHRKKNFRIIRRQFQTEQLHFKEENRKEKKCYSKKLKKKKIYSFAWMKLILKTNIYLVTISVSNWSD